jgi:Tol biopolymer transport system component
VSDGGEGGAKQQALGLAATVSLPGEPDGPRGREPSASDAGRPAKGLAPGVRVDRYVVEDVLGSGGMGIVYRARDPKLGRQVALKLVRPETAAGGSSSNAHQRLLREAQAMAKLAHPNTIAVYDVGSLGDQVFFAMELVDGGNLAQWLRERPRGWREVVGVFMQAGRGLEAAHAAGLVHRDFKPENVLVGRDGRARVVDLGLARPAAASEEETVSAHESPDSTLTATGAVVGTPRYMAPEQRRGLAVDARADQFSFCVALYQALYGEHPFAGATPRDLVDRILAGTPNAPPRAARAPRWLAGVVLRGLAPAPEARHASMAQLLAALEKGTRARRTWLTVAAAFVVVGGALAVGLARRAPQRAPALLPTEVRRQVTFTGDSRTPDLSPDGKRLAFVTGRPFRQKLIVQDLATGEAETLAWWPRIGSVRWSPDGASLLVRTVNGLAWLRADGAERRFWARLWGTAAWAPDGKSIASVWPDSKQVRFVDVATGDVHRIDVPVPSDFSFSTDWGGPDGRILILTQEAKKFGLWSMAPDGSLLRHLLDDRASEWAGTARWLPGGRIAYVRKRDGQPEIVGLRVIAADVAEEEGVFVRGADLLGRMDSIDGATFSFSRDGRRLAYMRSDMTTKLERVIAAMPLKLQPLLGGTQAKGGIRLSPDGSQLAVIMGASETEASVFVMPATGGAPRQVTPTGQHVHWLAWAPDGTSLVYTASVDQGGALWRVGLDGAPPRRLRTQASVSDGQVAWAPGRLIVYQHSDNRNFGVLDPETGREHPLVADGSVGWMIAPTVSPDGKRLAICWNRTSPRQVALWSMSLVDSAQTLLAPGNLEPFGWSSDGRWIYALSTEPLYMETAVRPGIVRVPADGGAAQRVMDFPPALEVSEAAAAPDGSFILVDSETHSDIWLTGDIAPDEIAMSASPARPPRFPPGHPEPARSAPTNLGFEEGDLGSPPPGWHLSETSRWTATAVLTDEHPHEGTSCLRLESKGKVGDVLQYLDAQAYRGKRVKVRAAVRTDLVPGAGAKLYVTAEFPDGFEERVTAREPAQGAGDWMMQEVVIDVGDDVEHVSYGVAIDGAGRVWIDAVSVEVSPRP